MPGVRFADTTQLSINTPAPVEANGLTFTQIGSGSKHACGLTAAGAAWCWGLNPGGQLGDGTQDPSLTPRAVSGGHLFASLAAHGPSHACALTAEGTAWCWGANGQGALSGFVVPEFGIYQDAIMIEEYVLLRSLRMPDA